MESADFLIVGGGVAGLSLGARLSAAGRVILLEREAALGFHSSGRSATFSHFGIGGKVVRELTGHSRSWFSDDGSAFCRTSPALFVATEEMRSALAALGEEAGQYGALEQCSAEQAQRLFPPLRIGAEAVTAALLYRDGLRLDADAMLQSFARTLRGNGGQIATDVAIDAITFPGKWVITSGERRWTAPVLVNAAGAWSDRLAGEAGLKPIGLVPLRRTIILVDPPAGAETRHWPFVKTAVDDFYILPEAGRLMASPVDEIASPPCDAQPEEEDIARAAWKVEQYTTLSVRRITHRWAGLRTFAPDRLPVVGFDPDAAGFFWLAGQGGFGLQTAPALAEAAASLVTGSCWPPALRERGIEPEAISPRRFRDA